MPKRLTWSRLLLAALVATATPPACGSKESSGPAVVPGALAGDVLEVSGAVTARRGDAPPRALAVGDTVSGDDVIETGADGAVVIELRHNHARWSLGASQRKQVAESAAWNAAARSGDEVAGGGARSTAAGRHAEREGADTAAGAAATAAAPAAPAAAAPAPEPPPPPAAEQQRRDQQAVASEERARAKEEAKVGRAAPKAPRAERAQTKAAADVRQPLGDVDDGAESKEATMDKKSGGGGTSAGIWSGTIRGALVVTGGLDQGHAQAAIDSKKSAYLTCWNQTKAKGPSQGAMTVKLSVDASGAVTAATVEGDGGAARGCVERVLRGLKFPSASAASTIETTLNFTTDQ